MYEFINEDLNKMKTDVFTKDYYANRVNQIIDGIKSIFEDYKGYLNMIEVSKIKKVKVKANILAKEIEEKLKVESISEKDMEILKKLLKEMLKIEDSLVEYNSRIWQGETKSGNVILFNTTPLQLDNPKNKGMISTSLIVNPKGKCKNSTYKSPTYKGANFGFGYKIKQHQGIIVGAEYDLQSGETNVWNHNNECFVSSKKSNVWVRNAGTKLCTPDMVAKKFKYGISEIVIPYEGHEKPDCMVFSGSKVDYIECRYLMYRAKLENLDIIEIPMNLGSKKTEEPIDEILISEFISRIKSTEGSEEKARIMVERYIADYEQYKAKKNRAIPKSIN